jgi:hypothetical protein
LTTSISAPTRIEKKKLKRKMKKTAKEITKFLNYPLKNNDSIKVFKNMPSFKYDYERLFIEHKYSVCKETIAQLGHRFIRDNKHKISKKRGISS